MRRQNTEALNAPFNSRSDGVRHCAHPGCVEEGAYRAPVSRDRLDEYHWFCLDHVREYNRAWDYFAGMSEAEIEGQRRWDTVWQRPSWPFGQFGEHAPHDAEQRIRDSYGFFSEDSARTAAARPLTEEQKALAILDLQEPVTFDTVKARYINLVKQLHPDANGDDPDAEERLKVVNQAYAALKISFA